ESITRSLSQRQNGHFMASARKKPWKERSYLADYYSRTTAGSGAKSTNLSRPNSPVAALRADFGLAHAPNSGEFGYLGGRPLPCGRQDLWWPRELLRGIMRPSISSRFLPSLWKAI